MAVGPRWYSAYEMACNAVTVFIEGAKIAAIPYSGTTARERELLSNSVRLTESESAELTETVVRQQEPAHIERISSLLFAAKSPRHILSLLPAAPPAST